ncbi:MAG: sodium:proton antiporter, partial [Microlunatus sp.]|nr:sodium:proton antiporter [Microlunatus sp.]
LPIVLPPLLFAATQRATVEQFRDAAGPVLLLAVGLTVATATVAAVVAHLAGLNWQAAAVLGAIVSPPDPVAATAVARRLRLPERLVTILEGEGLFNDATALVIYQVTVAVAITGEFSTGGAVGDLALAVGVGIVLGLLAGWLTKLALGALHDANAETTVTIAAPFVVYLVADQLGGSGVLAVLALGLYLRRAGHASLTAGGWLLGRSVWDYADFVITSLVFVLLGFELTNVLGASHEGRGGLILAALVIGAVVLFRPLWLFPATALARAVARRRATDIPYGWRETVVVSWAGMRGVVTVATALALPRVNLAGEPLAWRDVVVLVGLACALVTLVAQGLTLTPLVGWLGIGSEIDERLEVNRLRRRAVDAALESLRADDHQDPDPVKEAVITTYEARLQAQEAVQDAVRRSVVEGSSGESAEEKSAALEERMRDLLRLSSNVERELVLRARNAGEVTPAAADEVLGEIENRAARIEF